MTSPAPIKCGCAFTPVGGRIINVSQPLDKLARLLLLETDADEATLRKVLDFHQFLQELRDRITEETPTITAAQRHSNKAV